MNTSHFNANIQVSERLFVHTVWSHCPPSISQCPIRAAERKEDLQFTSHKSSTHFTTRWFGFYSVRLLFILANWIFLHAAQEEILFASMSEFTYQLHCCKSSLRWTMPDMDPINQKIFEGRSNFRLFFHNCYISGIVRQGQSVELLNTCIRQMKHSIKGVAHLSWWHFYLYSGEWLNGVFYKVFVFLFWSCPLSNVAVCRHVCTFWNESVWSGCGGTTCHRCADFYQPDVEMRHVAALSLFELVR